MPVTVFHEINIDNGRQVVCGLLLLEGNVASSASLELFFLLLLKLTQQLLSLSTLSFFFSFLFRNHAEVSLVVEFFFFGLLLFGQLAAVLLELVKEFGVLTFHLHQLLKVKLLVEVYFDLKLVN